MYSANEMEINHLRPLKCPPHEGGLSVCIPLHYTHIDILAQQI